MMILICHQNKLRTCPNLVQKRQVCPLYMVAELAFRLETDLPHHLSSKPMISLSSALDITWQ